MDQTSENPQIVYFHPQNARGCAMNLIAFGVRQFMQTAKYSNLALFKELADASYTGIMPDINKVTFLAMNQLIDCIRITICFENFSKALLLLKGFVIHKLSIDVFPDLRKFQFARPIHLSEILSKSTWEVNHSIRTSQPGANHQIKGILVNTIGMKELLSTNYQSVLQFSPAVINACQPFFDYRNNLHLYMSEEIFISKGEYLNFITIINFVNKNIVQIHNQVIDEMQKGEQYKLQELSYTM